MHVEMQFVCFLFIYVHILELFRSISEWLADDIMEMTVYIVPLEGMQPRPGGVRVVRWHRALDVKGPNPIRKL
jgi:hypothetical protein